MSHRNHGFFFGSPAAQNLKKIYFKNLMNYVTPISIMSHRNHRNHGNIKRTQISQISQIFNILRNLGFKELFLERSQRLLMDVSYDG